jgi:hypothetical protein
MLQRRKIRKLPLAWLARLAWLASWRPVDARLERARTRACAAVLLFSAAPAALQAPRRSVACVVAQACHSVPANGKMKCTRACGSGASAQHCCSNTATTRALLRGGMALARAGARKGGGSK